MEQIGVETKKTGLLDSLFRSKIFRFLSLIALFFSLWSGYRMIFPNKPNLFCEIVSDINVVNVNKPVSRLSVLVDGKDIIADSLSLKIYEIKIWNDGSDDLLKELYVSNSIGFEIVDGYIIEQPNVIRCSNDYISEEVEDYHFLTNNTIVELPKIALDKGESYTIQFIVLHKSGKEVDFSPFGKISKIKNLKIKPSRDVRQTRQDRRDNEILFSDTTFEMKRITFKIITIMGGMLMFIMILSAIASRQSQKAKKTSLQIESNNVNKQIENGKETK